jgi:hypothetical protein
MLRVIVAGAALLVAVSGCSSCGKEPAPKPKTKDEAFQVFEKHKATFVRCEKLLAAEAVAVADPGMRAAADAAAEASAPPDASDGGAAEERDGGAHASSRAGRDAGADASSDSGPEGGAAAGASAPAATPQRRTGGAAQDCQTDYWKAMKRDMGPYDQATMDQWYAEWRKGVKIE